MDDAVLRRDWAGAVQNYVNSVSGSEALVPVKALMGAQRSLVEAFGEDDVLQLIRAHTVCNFVLRFGKIARGDARNAVYELYARMCNYPEHAELAHAFKESFLLYLAYTPERFRAAIIASERIRFLAHAFSFLVAEGCKGVISRSWPVRHCRG
jgi:hypothetical protein